MTIQGVRGFGLAIVFAITSVTAGYAAAPGKQIPPPPTYYVLDEPHILDQQATRALQALLIEHDRTTGEQIIVAIFNSLDGEDLNDFTNRVFQKWEIGQRGKDNGVLLAIFNQDHKARIEVGYGLEPLLTDVKSSRILRDYLIPGMKAGQPNEAVTQSALQILQTIDSPLVQSGRAQQILRSGGVLRQEINSSQPMKGGWAVWLFLGLILMVIVSHIISSAEATFTRAGWYRPRPWRRRWWDDDDFGGPRSGGGGFFGGWGGGLGGGGGGGYSGGGGRSGGGGASAGW